MSAPETAIVTAEHLSKWYGQVIGLNDVSVTVPRGITGLLGPNGAGKSTFMKLITGQLRPSKGAINVLGEPIWQNPLLYAPIFLLAASSKSTWPSARSAAASASFSLRPLSLTSAVTH